MHAAHAHSLTAPDKIIRWLVHLNKQVNCESIRSHFLPVRFIRLQATVSANSPLVIPRNWCACVVVVFNRRRCVAQKVFHFGYLYWFFFYIVLFSNESQSPAKRLQHQAYTTVTTHIYIDRGKKRCRWRLWLGYKFFALRRRRIRSLL